MLESYEGIILSSTDSGVLGSRLGDIDGITPGFYEGTDMGYSDGSFDGHIDIFQFIQETVLTTIHVPQIESL